MGTEQIKKDLSIFFGDDELLLNELVIASNTKSFAAGKTMLRMLDDGNELYYILKGRAKAVIYSQDGHEIWIDDFEPYTTFGEIALFGNFRQTADIIAITNISVLSFSRVKFLTLMKQHGSIGINISQLIAKRMKETTNRRFELSAFSAVDRIGNELWRLATEDENGMMMISPIPAFTTIAKRVCSTRETVSRTVNEMESKGNVLRKHGKLILLPHNLKK